MTMVGIWSEEWGREWVEWGVGRGSEEWGIGLGVPLGRERGREWEVDPIFSILHDGYLERGVGAAINSFRKLGIDNMMYRGLRA